MKSPLTIWYLNLISIVIVSSVLFRTKNGTRNLTFIALFLIIVGLFLKTSLLFATRSNANSTLSILLSLALIKIAFKVISSRVPMLQLPSGKLSSHLLVKRKSQMGLCITAIVDNNGYESKFENIE